VAGDEPDDTPFLLANRIWYTYFGWASDLDGARARPLVVGINDKEIENILLRRGVMERGTFRTQAKRCGKVLVTGALVLGGLLSTQTMAQAKLLDILDVFSGGMEAGDTINAPIMASVTPTNESEKQALKYNNKVTTTFTATENLSSATAMKPVEVASYDTGAKKVTSTKNKTDEEDDPFTSLISNSSSNLSSIGRSGSHAFAFPSFSLFTTTPSAPAYTTDASYLQSELNNPEVTLSYMQQNFSYENHNGNTPYAPSELNSRRAGDCKDFATFFGWA
jgi:hypothetical protein